MNLTSQAIAMKVMNNNLGMVGIARCTICWLRTRLASNSVVPHHGQIDVRAAHDGKTLGW